MNQVLPFFQVPSHTIKDSDTMDSIIAPASSKMMAMAYSAQQMPKAPSPPPAQEIASLLSIKIPAVVSTCYCCKVKLEDGADYFCGEACELYYDTLMDHGLRTPDFVCEGCGYYMNPREGMWNRSCQGCQYNEQHAEYYDETEHMTTAELYRYMWPQTKSHPHDYETARDAVYEFLDVINDAKGEALKAYHAQYLFNYIADHGQYLLKTASFAIVILEKMVEFQEQQVIMGFYEFDVVFERLRKMIGEIQEKKE